MNAYNTPAVPAATDSDISALINHLGALSGAKGRSLPARCLFNTEQTDTAQALVVALGVPAVRAAAMRPHEFVAFYNVALKDIGSARRMSAKYRNEQAPVPVASAPAASGISFDDMEKLVGDAMAMLSKEVLGTARDDTQATLTRFATNLPTLIAEELENLAPTVVQVTQADKPAVNIQNPHEAFPRVLRYSAARVWPYLVGPAGSGKTTLAEHIATALGLPFYMAAKVQSDFALLGHIQPHNGEPYRTPFREAYEHGGVFLFDEMDGSNANALTAFNAALANGHCPFPDGLIKRHADFIAIGAGNTYGKGASRQYVGRTQIDDATLDRFAFIEIDYDEKLERQIAANKQWCSYVQAVRKEVMAKNIRHIVSPRCTYSGSTMIAAGETWADAAQALLWKGLDPETVRQIQRAVPMAPYNSETELSIL